MNPEDAVEETKAGPVLRVRVRARARADAVGWTAAAGVRVTVRPAPEKGRANEAVVRAIAAWLGVPARDVDVVSGTAAVDKRLSIAGMTTAELRSRVRALASDG
ncbi:MAG: DUF167 domain-containing protein [Actinomycetota bacterium]